MTMSAAAASASASAAAAAVAAAARGEEQEGMSLPGGEGAATWEEALDAYVYVNRLSNHTTAILYAAPRWQLHTLLRMGLLVGACREGTADDIVLAVYVPPQEPAPGIALVSISFNSSSLSLPPE